MCHCCALARRPSGVADCLDVATGIGATGVGVTGDGAAHDASAQGDGRLASPSGARRTVDDYTALLTDHDWNGSGVTGQGAFVTYSFDVAANQELDEGQAFLNSFRPLTAAEREVTRTALSQWADASGLVFLEVAAGEGDISLGVYDLGRSADASGAAGYAYLPGRYIVANDARFDVFDETIGGDIVMDDDLGGLEYFRDVMLHEIGHAIGLKHPFSGDTVLADRLDDSSNTVMSYTSATPGPATRLGPLDVAAARHVYGIEDGGHLDGWSWQVGAKRLVQIGTGGDDAIFGISVRDVIRGWGGDDEIAGFGGDDVLHGDAGDDRIDGGEGDDVLIGGTGNDVLDGGDGADVLNGLSGDDLLIGGAGDDVYHVDAPGESTFVDGMWSSVGDEVREWQGGGTDTVFTRVSLTLPDEVEIGVAVGAVDLTGNYSDNTLRGSAAANRLDGGKGDDRLFGGEGRDVLMGGWGADRLDGGAGFDVADYGGEFRGVTIDLDARDHGGSAFGDVLVGIEAIRGTDSSDIVRGTRRGERFEGRDGHDTLDGRDGNDVLDGGAGNDRLFGGGGNDVLKGGTGADRLDGGVGFDTADYSDASSSIAVDLNARVQGGGADGDVLVGIEAVRGTDGDDALLGRFADEALFGNAGDDALDGRYGNDRLFGGDGDDRVLGGAGNDVLDGGAGADLLAGQAGIDTVSYASSRTSVTADLIRGGSRGDAAGDTYGSIENIVGGRAGDVLGGNVAANRIDGGTGFDILLGRGGNDVLLGGAQNDFLSGGAGADVLAGGMGDDRLRGDAGADRLFGGAGNDLFVYLSANDSRGAARDTILDFRRGQDRIDLSAIDGDGGAPGNGAFAFIGARAFTGDAGEVRFAGGTVQVDVNGDARADMFITVNGVAAIGAADFVL